MHRRGSYNKVLGWLRRLVRRLALRKTWNRAAAQPRAVLTTIVNQLRVTTPLVACGETETGSVLVTADLNGFEDAEKLVRRGLDFETLLIPTADLAAR